ncbi:MAG TPA: hypothetical protein VF553_11940 [Pyrinomonadaceae bacterium]|jgi:hypothetical protein
MSTAKLNVWVTKVGDPCKIDNDYQWFVHILHCNGEILKWCGKSYSNLMTKCGHLEIEIPPGCYMVCATWSPAPNTTVPTTLGNHISHLQIIRANCGKEICVTLFPPTFHWCGIWWLVALREQAAMQRFPAQAEARNAINAVETLLKKLPMDNFTQAMLEIERNPVKPAGAAESRSRKGSSKKR